MQLATITAQRMLFEGVHRIWDESAPIRGRTFGSRLYQGVRAGESAGYATLTAAIDAAGLITDEYRGGGGAVAALREGARYVLYSLLESTNIRGPKAWDTPQRADFEYREDYIVHRAERATFMDTTLRALIDGSHIQRFAPGSIGG